MPLRGRKWLRLLDLMRLVRKVSPPKIAESGEEVYDLGEVAIQLFGQDGSGGSFYKEMLRWWQIVDKYDFTKILLGEQNIQESINWPPATKEEAAHIEYWMSVTVEEVFKFLDRYIGFQDIGNLLDAGGGVGTLAIIMASRYPHLKISVFNLPNSAALARENIAQARLSDRISVVEGNFLKDEPFPPGYDTVLWSRVLLDWDSAVTFKVLKKSYDALVPGGRVIVCESLADQKIDMVFAWEFRYAFYDQGFGIGTYKFRGDYYEMLRAIGFEIVDPLPVHESNIYNLVIGRRPGGP